MKTNPVYLQATYQWALRQSRRNAERAFLKYLVTLLEHREKEPPRMFHDINEVMCIALTGSRPRDLFHAVDPGWASCSRESLIEAIKVHLASQDQPSSPFDDELAFGSGEADRDIACVLQQWVGIAQFMVQLQEGSPEEIVDAMTELRLSVGWGVIQPEPSDQMKLTDTMFEGYRLGIRRRDPGDPLGEESETWLDRDTGEDG